jgi:predicted 3-demethylubiquinone-9 3-methyltransferase (glyoxalase superfamily)
MTSIMPCLWFDDEAEDAAKFYCSIFKDGKLGAVTRYGNEGRDIHGGEPGSVLTVEFTANGQRFLALNGGPHFKFNEAVSFQVLCDSQDEVDYYWEKLSAGGDPKAQQCGWLKDKFGLSWQVVPVVLSKLLADQDRAKADRVMKALLQMRKLDIALLQRAHAGRASLR